MASDKPADQYEEVFEEGDVPKEAQTVHRIRANSTIMQLNKILGQSHSHSIERGTRRGWCRGRRLLARVSRSVEPMRAKVFEAVLNNELTLCFMGNSCQPW